MIINENVLIEGDRLSITKLNMDMCFDIHKNSLDEDNRRFVPDEVFETLEIAKEVVQDLIDSYESEDGPYVFAIIRKIDDVNLGYIQLVKIDLGWEIGYHIAKQYTSQGYATEAVKLFLDYLKDNSDYKKIYGVALSDNMASRRVLEKCDFKLFFEGIDFYQGEKRKIIKTIRKL